MHEATSAYHSMSKSLQLLSIQCTSLYSPLTKGTPDSAFVAIENERKIFCLLYFLLSYSGEST